MGIALGLTYPCLLAAPGVTSVGGPGGWILGLGVSLMLVGAGRLVVRRRRTDAG